MGGQRHTPGMTRYPLYRRMGGPHSQFGRVRNIAPPPGFDLRTVQAVAIRHTDYAIPHPQPFIIATINSYMSRLYKAAIFRQYISEI